MRPASWGAIPEQNPPLQAISAAAGDAIVFTYAQPTASTPSSRTRARGSIVLNLSSTLPCGGSVLAAVGSYTWLPLNISGAPRRTLYYCYSTGWMPDWGGQSLQFTMDLGSRLSPAQAEIIRLK